MEMDRPWLTNFQMIIHVDYAADPSDVFKAKSDIQAILDSKNATVKGCKLEVRVEAGQERKKWLTTYFNHVRAIEAATGLSSTKGEGLLHLELRTFSVFHIDHPNHALGKLNKGDTIFEYDEEVLARYNITAEDVRKHVNGASQQQAEVNRAVDTPHFHPTPRPIFDPLPYTTMQSHN